MSFQELVTASRKYFPSLQIKYKNQSWIMRLVGKLFFLNPDFMTSYTTTIGHTIYFPDEKFIKTRSVSSSVILLHELVHFYDQKRIGKLTFIFSYLFPQILVPIFGLLMFLITWKIMLPLMLFCALPIPAVFRMHWERRAYLSSLYVMRLLGNRLHFNPHLKTYYFMWPFHDINQQFDQVVDQTPPIQRPFQDPVFEMLEELVSKV
jgi:hypothetical protein